MRTRGAARQKELFVVPVGGEQEQVGPACRDGLPLLHPVGKRPGRKDAKLIEPGPAGGKGQADALGQPPQGVLRVQVIVEHPAGIHLNGTLVLGQRKRPVGQVEHQVEAGDPVPRAQGEAGVRPHVLRGLQLHVKQRLPAMDACGGNDTFL